MWGLSTVPPPTPPHFQTKNPSQSSLSSLLVRCYKTQNLNLSPVKLQKCETKSETVCWLPCGNFCALPQSCSLAGCLLPWLELAGVSEDIKSGSEGRNYNIVHKMERQEAEWGCQGTTSGKTDMTNLPPHTFCF